MITEQDDRPLPWPTPSRPAPRLERQPALDGIRGLAVAAVVCYHLALLDALGGLGKVARGGFLGVSAFFTLSGFLITSLLIAEFGRDRHISLRRFWGRRARRLLPAALITLAGVGLAARWLASPDQLQHLKAEMLAALAYVANWRFIIGHSDYAATFTAQSPVKHLWSLSVEEEWYLVIPLLVAAALWVRRGRRDLLTAVLAVGTIGTVALGWWLDHGAYSNRVYLGTDTRFPELAIGALLAVALAGRLGGDGWAAGGRALWRRLLDIGSVVVIVGLVAAWATTSLENRWLYRGGLALHALAVAVVIASAVQPGTIVNRVFRWRPAMALGRISYAVYLIHWPVILWMTPARLHLDRPATAVVQTAVTLSLATLSYHVIETPIRSGRLVVNWRRVAVPAAALAIVAVVALLTPVPSRAVLTAPLDTDRRVVARATPPPPSAPATTAPGAPPTTAPPAPVRVLVVGDSFAISMVPGLDRAALTGGQVAVMNGGIIGCAFGRGGLNRGLNIPIPFNSFCKNRDNLLGYDLATFHPDVVVMAGGVWDVSDRELAGTHTWVHIGEPGYDTYLAGELRHAADVVQASGAQLVWLTAPDWKPVYTPGEFMAPGPYAESDPHRVDLYNQILASSLAGRPRTQILDLASWLKAQPGGEFAPTVRADGVHLTDTTTNAAAAWLIPQLLAVVRGSGAG